MDINLINYKFFSESYIEYETNRKGKEYKYGELIFEGEYFHGKRWYGKGFKGNNNIIYILENEKGIIKEYYHNGKLKIESEYLN